MSKKLKFAFAVIFLILVVTSFFLFLKPDLFTAKEDQYVGHGEECTYIDYDCQPGFKHFYDGIGCGCAATTP